MKHPMKRRDFLKTTAATTALAFLGDPLRGSEDSQKTPWVPLWRDSGSQVGWARLRVNADGELIVKVRLVHGLAKTPYGVDVVFNPGYHEEEVIDLDPLMTNRAGRGKVNLTLPFAECAEDGTLDIQIRLYQEEEVYETEVVTVSSKKKVRKKKAKKKATKKKAKKKVAKKKTTKKKAKKKVAKKN